MPFVELLLAETELEGPKPVPAGNYTFQVQPGAEWKESKFAVDQSGNPIQELNVRFDIVDGEYAGRPVFVRYPDPSAVSKNGKSMKWSAQALKKLEISLGTDALPGEGTAAYLNRVATSGNNRFGAAMIPGKYTKPGSDTPEIEFGIYTVHPAA